MKIHIDVAKYLKALKKGHRGGSLVIVLAFTTMGFLVVPPLLSYAFSATKANLSYQVRTSGIYAADSGVRDAFLCVQQPLPDVTKVPLNTGTTPAPYSIADLNDKHVSVQVSMVADNSPDSVTYKITSDATGGGQTQHIEAFVLQTLGKVGFGEFALAASNISNFTKNNSSVVAIQNPSGPSASIYAGSFTAEAGTDIQGNVFSPGDITGGDIQGQSYPHSPQHALATIDTNLYKDEASAASGATPQAASLFEGGGTFDGPRYVNGNLDLSGDLTINGDIYVNGSLTVNGNLTVNTNGSQKGVLYVSDYLSINANLHTAGTIYTGGDLTMHHTSALDQPGVIVVSGNVSLDKWNLGPPVAGSPYLPTIMMLGTSFVVGTNDSVRAFIYAPNALVDFTNAASSGLEGAIIANAIEFGNQDFIYRNDILGNAYGGLGGAACNESSNSFKLENWKLQ